MSLRNKVIKLAHEKPELRKDILPLLKQGGRMVSEPLGKHVDAAAKGWLESLFMYVNKAVTSNQGVKLKDSNQVMRNAPLLYHGQSHFEWEEEGESESLTVEIYLNVEKGTLDVAIEGTEHGRQKVPINNALGMTPQKAANQIAKYL